MKREDIARIVNEQCDHFNIVNQGMRLTFTRIAEGAFDAGAADPWQRITADPGTLPPCLERIITTSKDGTVEAGCRKKAMYGVREIDIILHENGDWTNLEDCLAWQPWPAPAPFIEDSQ